MILRDKIGSFIGNLYTGDMNNCQNGRYTSQSVNVIPVTEKTVKENYIRSIEVRYTWTDSTNYILKQIFKFKYLETTQEPKLGHYRMIRCEMDF